MAEVTEPDAHDLLTVSGDETRELIRKLLDGAPDAITVVDADGCITLFNLQAEQLFGYTREELIGRPVEVLIPERFRAGHVQHRGQFRQKPALRPMGSGLSLYGRRRDGSEFPIEISLSPVNTAHALLTAASIRDISARTRQEAELREAQLLAEAASSAKSEFLASMSHELRTPLNAILGFAQLLQRDRKTPLSERQQERIGHVLKGGEHLLRLIDEVLDLARIEAGGGGVSLEPVAVPKLLEEIAITLEALAARQGICVGVAPLPSPLPDVLADPRRLQQVLMNYGSNAIKYGRHGGRVELAASVHDGRLRIAVRDDGIGIPNDQQAKLFQPFQRAGQETGPIEGTGIGLTISKRLAELMHGAVGFESTPGRGSMFWIELPIPCQPSATQSPEARALPASDPLRTASGPRFTLVYIEDHPSNLAFMQDFLADYPRIRLLTAQSAETGLPLVRAERPDAVIMDLNLPGMHGLEATKQLQAWPETRHIPVIGLSAAAMVRDAARVNGAGFHRYLTKPVDVEELARTLDELLGREP